MTADSPDPPRRTALHGLHLALGGRMVSFAGHELPLRYGPGIVSEHLHTRARSSLFDVSHMGQIALRGDGAAAALEALVPGDVRGLGPGRMRYTMLTNDAGGIVDDLVVVNVGSYLFLVVNAARKRADLALLRAALPAGVAVEELADRSLVALQGPASSAVLARFAPGAERMAFMSARPFRIAGSALAVMRSGYTGEDGYEISMPSSDAERVAETLLGEEEVAPAGLGARDSLRLEAGLCLHGRDIDETTTPVEAALEWTIARRRREEGGFAGAGTVLRQLRDGAPRQRVGLAPDGRAPAREGAAVVDGNGRPIGAVTSGGFGPSVGGPVAMGYVDASRAEDGTPVGLVVRGTARAGRIRPLPFVPRGHYRGKGG